MIVNPLLLKAAENKPEALPFLVSKLFQPLYIQYVPPAKGTVFLLTQVHPDGFGDYLALIKAARALKKYHPALAVELVFTYSRPLPEVDTSDLILHPFIESPAQPILEPVLEGKALPSDTAESILAHHLYQRMQSALAIIHIALAINTFDNPLLRPKSLYFAESGNFQGFPDSATFNWYSCGLGPFEEGIFLDTPYPSRENHQRYLAYLPKNPLQAETFAKLIALLEPNHTVEIIHPREPLPYATFQALMQDSGPLVGCTGDGSLSECLALGKIPYYEMREHKSETLASLLQLASFLQLPDIVDYFQTMSDWKNEPSLKLYAILKRPTFQPAWQKMIAYIHTWCRLEDSLIARFHRLLWQTKELEMDLAEQVLTKKMSYEQAYKHFEGFLASR